MFPVILILSDELIVQRGGLIGIVVSLGMENQVQPDIEFEVVHRTKEFLGPEAAGEKDRAGMMCEILLARRDELCSGVFGWIMEGKENIMCKHWFRHFVAPIVKVEGQVVGPFPPTIPNFGAIF